MSRLNSVIKLLFCWGELFFVLVSLIFVLASGSVSTGNVAALNFQHAQQTATLILILSVAVFLCTCFGACGAVRQTLRRGCCTGRKMLFLHQLLLVGVLVFSFSQYERLNKREHSIKLVISDPNSYPYDSFERRVSKYFNDAYWESICSNDPSTTWLLNFVEKQCPESMGKEHCSLPGEKKENCDTSCPASEYFKCCPSEDLCNDGNKASCPYHRCRVEILEELHVWAAPTKVAAQFVCVLSVIMLVLSCLLICFNPRDEIEMELLKTGVMTTEDVEAIRRLKESANVVTKRGSIDVERLDTLKEEQKKSKFRKRTSRVSPTNT